MGTAIRWISRAIEGRLRFPFPFSAPAPFEAPFEAARSLTA
ncbi:hypothetical protein NJB1907f44_04330 [Mycobacterium marinum]|nr:hypothetical protein NJB1907E8_44340 [Mycobacterium marinum]GJN97386.1 hypothetical protein NJB1808e29_13100 [Mycobacterium marinum]GJO01026.1 hypothetical protein NJB1907E90_04040 [Mycobacterium marinum]GJO09716.1 hypothetical protein NJB1907f34b_40590 [Mycobacterium marinum]GJO12902.1 hypothetical protein NJB1728e18_00800 [Mycobacterium marinum]